MHRWSSFYRKRSNTRLMYECKNMRLGVMPL